MAPPNPPGVRIRSAEHLISLYPDRFEYTDAFPGEYRVTDGPSHPPRRPPIHLRDTIKTELNDMESLGVIQATHVLEELTHHLKEDTVFSTLEAVHGRAYSRSHTRMDAILKVCPGTIPIANGVCIFGKGEEIHDANTHNLMRVARKHNIVFNPREAIVKQNCDKFHDEISRENRHYSNLEDPSSLAYYRPDRDPPCQSDKSISGLSGVIIQDGRPLVVCSKALTGPEPRCANIHSESVTQMNAHVIPAEARGQPSQVHMAHTDAVRSTPKKLEQPREETTCDLELDPVKCPYQKYHNLNPTETSQCEILSRPGRRSHIHVPLAASPATLAYDIDSLADIDINGSPEACAAPFSTPIAYKGAPIDTPDIAESTAAPTPARTPYLRGLPSEPPPIHEASAPEPGVVTGSGKVSNPKDMVTLPHT